MAYLVLTYGMRQGELRSLHWPDVGADTLSVRRVNAKTEASARTLPLLDETQGWLARYRKAQAAERLAAPTWADNDLVFTDEAGRALTSADCLAWWHALCDKAHVRHCRMHAGRHAAASELFARGVEIEVVSAILGHKDVATTRRIYLRIREDLKRKALRKVAS